MPREDQPSLITESIEAIRETWLHPDDPEMEQGKIQATCILTRTTVGALKKWKGRMRVQNLALTL